MTTAPGRLGRRCRVAYLGPPGTFSEEALLADGDLAACELVPAATIEEAIDAAARGDADAAFVPLENSIEGSVNVTLDRLVFGEEMFIQREIVLDVHLDLLARPGTSLDEVRSVRSFPVATAQCRGWLAAHLPDAEVLASTSTAEAARQLAEAGAHGDAAVAPGLAGKLYGLDTLAHAIEDHDGNQTRFVLVAPGRVPAPTGRDKTTLVCFQHADRPGSLHEILGRFAARSLNLTRIESRPTKRGLGDYCFVVDVEGHLGDQLLSDCLEELRSVLGDVRFLGSYPAVGAGSPQLRAEIAERRSQARAWLESLRAKLEHDPPLVP